MLAELEYEYRRVKIDCPTCGKEQFVKLQTEGMAIKNGIMSLVIRAPCDHEFHLYLDKSYNVRGYEKCDLIVASEMMQVDDAISSFMKNEGMKEKTESMKNSKVRNEFDRESFLEIFIKFFRSIYVAEAYFPSLLQGGSEVGKKKMDSVIQSTSLEQISITPNSVTTDTTQQNEIEIEQIPGQNTSAQITEEPVPPDGEQAEEIPKGSLAVEEAEEIPKGSLAIEEAEEIPKGSLAVEEAEEIPKGSLAVEEAEEIPKGSSEETSGMEISFETIKTQYENRIKKINEIMIKLELQNLDEDVSDVDLVKKKAKLQKIREELDAQFNKLLQDHGIEKQDLTIDDEKAQFEERIKKINQVMINLELQNLNEAVTDIEFEKKKLKLEQIRDDLKAQYNKFLKDHGIEHQDLPEEESSE